MVDGDYDHNAKRLKAIWDQDRIPVVLRRGGKGQSLRARLPFESENREWLRNRRRTRPVWIGGENQKYWELPKAWFNDFVNRALKKYGMVYIIQPYREQEICARACMEAEGHECQCSCMGANHGSGFHGSWFEVSETFAVRSREPELACRLMVSKRA
ncbi:hypothetical protein EN978_07160 [Mesorhizobium sp. M7A.F.Ca.US.001.04.1.1]|uniref:hypothetical protein n=1 Tax=Mesorhizobium sp. M7A.F.Ca.US.001.04.1.1 TaxID=2496726 RepID=UPI000FCC623F|nr:hypothetical protein [Mesorhizobium sp. M7A.F.Ca.US.001.04.1.1]RUY31708.1 hypothetical protein EN979_02120 [Mesorhizobium sp. M7A.F.Ca.US.001.04.2.1]RUY44104.1 hypothetical protein EN978_07160 [Mesorhizobium sp. M7A.F.Ca.US.001.04.1.1]